MQTGLQPAASMGDLKSLWDYDITLSEDSHPFRPEYLGEDASAAGVGLDASAADPSAAPDPLSKECYGEKGVLASILAAEHVDSDWITGVMLAQEIVPALGFNKFSVSINTWHSGCDTGLLRGFNHFCVASRYSGHKNVKWDWCGMDIKSDREHKLAKAIIAVGPSDLTIGSNLVNSINFMKGRDVHVVFHDICPKTHHILISGLIISMMTRKYAVIRLPDAKNWDQTTLDVMIVLAMLFKKLHLWSPQWGLTSSGQGAGARKIYIIACDKKQSIYKASYRNFLALLKPHRINGILKKSVYADEKTKNWLTICQNIRMELMGDTGDAKGPLNAGELVELLTTNLVAIPSSKKII
jgi:hypothetical protein